MEKHLTLELEAIASNIGTPNPRKFSKVIDSSTLIDSIATLLAVVALILSVVATRIGLSQASIQHHDNFDLAIKENERSRFDALLVVTDKLLEKLADLRADLHPYWKVSDKPGEESNPTTLEDEQRVHRTLEQFFILRHQFDGAIALLPESELDWGKSKSDLEEQRRYLRQYSAWLQGCAMGAYFALVTDSLKTKDNQVATYDAVLATIVNNSPWEAFDSDDDAKRFLHGERDRRVGLPKGKTLATNDGPTLDAANLAYSELNAAMVNIRSYAAQLQMDYSQATSEALKRLQSKRRRGFWLNSGMRSTS